MKKSVFAHALVAGVLLLSLPTAAQAATEDDGYTPGVDDSMTLAGSEVAGVCDNDVPWIEYSVFLTDSNNESAGQTARLVLSNGSQSKTITLGTLGDDGTLEGRILWPGASIAADGSPTGWPGWAFVDGAWVETDDNYAWTRGDISATIEVNPELDVALSYPPSNPYCSTRPPVTGEAADVGGDSALPDTGGTFDALPFVFGGAAVLLAGAGLLVYSRRRAH